MSRSFRRRAALAIILISRAICVAQDPASPEANDADLADRVTIHRDQWGVPHIFGDDLASVSFGMGYAQAEDYFWQVEDNCIRAIGRYSEVYGESELRGDLLNRVFEIAKNSQADVARLAPEFCASVTAFADGINYYLAKHPDVKPRLINKFEPWHVLAMERHFLMDFTYGRSHAGKPSPNTIYPRRINKPEAKEVNDAAAPSPQPIWEALSRNPKCLNELERTAQSSIGSNAWAIAPSKTKSKSTMLLVNPHQPWYGWGQFYEAHIYCPNKFNFTGACFYGNPIPSMGHNEHLGWAYTVNEPDIADAWNVEFDDPAEPLNYRHGDTYKKARQWQDTISIKRGNEYEQRTYEFRATHHGPIVQQKGKTRFVAAQIARLHSLRRVDQSYGMLRSKTFEEWRAAFSECAISMFNVAYADREGNIFYCGNGAIPIRDASFDWTRTVNGSDPRTDWKGIHSLNDLPQVLNPPSGYVQNCNSSPFVTTDEGNPNRGDYLAYMYEDADHDKRRSKLSRKLLRESNNLTFEEFQSLSTDNRLYWPMTMMPEFKRDLERMAKSDPERAKKIRPYLEHLSDWDFRASIDSTQTALCLAWYEELYGQGYPGEELKEQYRRDHFARLDALMKAAKAVKSMHGDWKVAWGDIHRLQRTIKRKGVLEAALGLSGFRKSLPCPGAPGPLGIVFTVYSSPTVPIIRKQRFAVVGNSYLSAVEFGEKTHGVSLTPFGASADRDSKHYFDQAELFSQQKMKSAWLYPEDVKANAERSYKLSEVE